MSAGPRFPDSVFDRIASYLPDTQRTGFYRYVAHLRTLKENDELMMLAEGMGIFVCIARDVPAALIDEREKLIGELTELNQKFEATTDRATSDVRAMFAAHQKLLEQNIGQWQSREQQTLRALEAASGSFEKAVANQLTRLQTQISHIEAVTKEHRGNAERVHNQLQYLDWNKLLWPCLGSAFGGALFTAALVYFRNAS
jgi:hypothetical protein